MSAPYDWQKELNNPETGDFALWKQEVKLWAELTDYSYEIDAEQEVIYHQKMSDKCKTGEPTWWVRSVMSNQIIIDYFNNEILVGTIYSHLDRGNVSAEVVGRKPRYFGLPLNHAVEWIENTELALGLDERNT